jgi:hypothetical protein
MGCDGVFCELLHFASPVLPRKPGKQVVAAIGKILEPKMLTCREIEEMVPNVSKVSNGPDSREHFHFGKLFKGAQQGVQLSAVWRTIDGEKSWLS